MKKLEFKTSKGEFILLDCDTDGRIKLPTDIEYQELGRVKDMTEEQFAEVVDNRLVFQSQYIKDMLNCYTNYSDPTFVFTSAKESFESLVKSLGWYLWENPLDSTKYLFGEGKDQNNFFVRLPKRKWQEAESKTLYSPILLKKI